MLTPRLDVLVVPRRDEVHPPHARVLRGLWEHLPRETVLEFKSHRRPLRPRDLDKLSAYVSLHFVLSAARLPDVPQLAFALVAARRSPTLAAELAAHRLVDEVLQLFLAGLSAE